MEIKSTINPKCSMLINQNMYIDDDPLGHTCYNDAVYTDWIHFYCNDCKKKLYDNDQSVTKPNFNSVAAWSMAVELSLENIKSGGTI